MNFLKRGDFVFDARAEICDLGFFSLLAHTTLSDLLCDNLLNTWWTLWKFNKQTLLWANNYVEKKLIFEWIFTCWEIFRYQNSHLDFSQTAGRRWRRSRKRRGARACATGTHAHRQFEELGLRRLKLCFFNTKRIENFINFVNIPNFQVTVPIYKFEIQNRNDNDKLT